MSLFRYLSPVSKPYLPDPEEQGTSSEAREVRTVNKEVEKALETGDKWHKRKNRCNFHYDGETCANIGRFVAKNGNKCAMEKFSRELQRPINESTVRGFKKSILYSIKEDEGS